MESKATLHNPSIHQHALDSVRVRIRKLYHETKTRANLIYWESTMFQLTMPIEAQQGFECSKLVLPRFQWYGKLVEKRL